MSTVDHQHPSALALASGRSASHLSHLPVPTVEVEVTRRIDRPVRQVTTALGALARDTSQHHVALAQAGWLSLDAGSACVGLDGSTWRGRGLLHPHRWWSSRAIPIDVEVSAWSAAASQLRLRAQGEPTRWGRRRLARYFTLAHLAADRLRRALADPGTDLRTATRRFVAEGEEGGAAA